MSRTPFGPPRILAIDDDPSTRLLITEHLVAAGCEVEEADGGRGGIARFKSWAPDLVLLDLLMPDMDGYETLGRIRESPGGVDCPVIIITGLEDGASIDLAFERGATDFITKPINWMLLGHRVRYVLRASRAAAELRRSRARLAEAQQIASLGNWHWDHASGVVSGSAEFFRILGLIEGDTGNVESILERVDPQDRPALQWRLTEAMERRRSFRLDVHVRSATGLEQITEIEGRPVVDPHGGGAVGVVGTLQDITEQKENERELLLARETAIEASRLKTEFVANVSHELRTPMNGIMGMSELLQDSGLGEEQQELVDGLCESSKRLLGMIENLLDFSRLDAGRVQLAEERFDVRRVVELVVEPVRRMAARKGVETILRIADGVPSTVRADPRRLAQVFRCLLDNSTKFTEQGAIVVDVTVSDNARSPGVECAIRDTGVGIPFDRQQCVFDAFTQADGSTSRRHEGAGLGLPIASQLVRMMGGCLAMESTVDCGSVFRFTLPFRRGELPGGGTARPAGWMRPGEVAIVEPDDASRDRLSRLLRVCGWSVRHAGSVREARTLVAGDGPARVLLAASLAEGPLGDESDVRVLPPGGSASTVLRLIDALPSPVASDTLA